MGRLTLSFLQRLNIAGFVSNLYLATCYHVAHLRILLSSLVPQRIRPELLSPPVRSSWNVQNVSILVPLLLPVHVD